MKKLLLTIISIALISHNAFALYPNKTSYEFHYKGDFIELNGNYFLTELLILPRKDMFQERNLQSVVDSFRHIFTAYELKDHAWLKKYTIGKPQANATYTKKYLKSFAKDELFLMLGYALYGKYAIVFLKNRDTGIKSIYTMEKNISQGYVPTTNFKHFHPQQYKIIEMAYKGFGDFKIVKNK